MKKPKTLDEFEREMVKQRRRAQQHRRLARYYCLNSILGNQWAIFYVIIGGRKTGKSYSVTDYLVKQHLKRGKDVKNYWLRISPTSTKALLAQNAMKLVDPDLVRHYGLSFVVRQNDVYTEHGTFCTVMPLSEFGKQKGVGFYDKDFDGLYNIVLDEFQLEQGERRTSFDILYNFIGMCENLVRTTKKNVRVFLLGNTLEEASTILKAFNFLPEKFGRFYLKSKRCVIDNLEPTEEYLADRKGSIADILGGDDLSNYTNELKKDRELIYKGRLLKPSYLIKFSRYKGNWYTVYDGNVIRRYRGEGVKKDRCICMVPYLDGIFSRERRMQVIEQYDYRGFQFDSLITQSYFSEELSRIRTK